MDFILRHLNARGLLIAVLSALGLYIVGNYYDAPYQFYLDRHFAKQRGAVAAPDIAADLDARESKRLQSLYRDVSAEIAAAAARGRRVESLQGAADAALKLDAPATRALAIDELNRLRLAIPQAQDALRPSIGSDDKLDQVATPPSSAPKRHKRRARSS
ncbi:MAG TPA: hypothetical protein VN915_15650 [Elusimicrobiota bacterium]|nr:hypothetical protein [Elusimicrobiota bacterium]